MTITVTGIGSNATPANNLNITPFSPAPAAGDSIIFSLVTDSSTVTFTLPTGGGYSQVDSQFCSLDGQQMLLAMKNSASGSETATGNTTNSGGAGEIGVAIKVNGLDATTKQDVTEVHTTDNTGSSVSPRNITASITPVTNGCAIIAIMGSDITGGTDVTTTFSTTAGSTGAWTKLYDINSGFYNLSIGYAIQTTAAPITVQASNAFAANTCGGTLMLMALRPAGGGGGFTAVQRRSIGPRVGSRSIY